MARTSRRRRAAKLMAKPSVKAESFLDELKYNEDDRISKLPNDILVNILDRLNCRDVTRTSVLSKHWSQLPAMLSWLQISARDFMPSQTSISDDELDETLAKINTLRRINAINAANAAVVKATKSMLEHRGPGGCTIRLLSMAFYLRGDAPISIGHTVGNAMARHKVNKAEFTVLTEKEHKLIPDDVLNYGTRFVSFFNECLNAFACLTRLELANLRFPESDFVSSILVTCKHLNYLGFHNCDTSDWITLQVEHAQLSELSIFDCRFDMVELTWVPKLTWLAFLFWRSSQELPLSLGYVPLLRVLRLSNIARTMHKMVKLSTLLHETSVQDMTLGFKCEKIWVQPECLTRRQAHVFQQLRILNLVNIPEGYDLTWTMFFLEAAPSLEELYMTVIDHPCEMLMDQELRREEFYSDNKGVEWESPTSNFKHHRLAKLTIFCFQSEDYMMSHVRRVMKAAVNLEDVYLFDRLTCDRCRGVTPLKPIRFPEESRHRRWVEKQIRKGGIESLATIHFLGTDAIGGDILARIATGY
ncbi:hypothetical protein ACQJBY_056200 [Aegilops geniculata]